MAAHTIKILGKGCGSCEWTERLVREVVEATGADVVVEKVTKTSEMIPYGVMSTPAVVVDERVVHAGGVPSKAEVERWVASIAA
jgi:small redox-active disulfide protein 2